LLKIALELKKYLWQKLKPGKKKKKKKQNLKKKKRKNFFENEKKFHFIFLYFSIF